ncbi:MAG: glycosyltransferase [Bacteroidales bacterium]
MKVLLFSTSLRQGGAAIACYRLWQALQKAGVSCGLMARDGKAPDSSNPTVTLLSQKPMARLQGRWAFLWERFSIWMANGGSRKNLFAVSLANTGVPVASHQEVAAADILHIHWVQQGFLSLAEISRLQKTGKPIVWTLHDMWAFTGICHYAGACDRYTRQCKKCPQLRNPSAADISYKRFLAKAQTIDFSKIVFVGCSEWIAQKARESSLLRESRVVTIPNPINTDLFAPMSREEARLHLGIKATNKVILFGAAKVTDSRKGIHYFLEACKILFFRQSVSAAEITVIYFGSDEPTLSSRIPFPSVHLQYLHSEGDLAAMYAAADLFVIPSIEDNLPNTVVEALACGTPVAGFATGGIGSMIEPGKNGELATPGSAHDLAMAIYKVLFASDPLLLSRGARHSALSKFREDVVAAQYKSLYSSLLHKPGDV